jgi:hypothetical protein
VKVSGKETFLLFVTSSFSFGDGLDRLDEAAIVRGVWAASYNEQRSIAATRSRTVPPAPQAKQWKTWRARFTWKASRPSPR